MKAPAESTMMKYWRMAVRAKRGDWCVFPGCTSPADQCHHFVHRKFKLTRYDVENGLPLCMTHHNRADRLNERMELEKLLDMEYLQSLTKYTTIKDFLVERGMTEKEFLIDELEALKGVVNGG